MAAKSAQSGDVGKRNLQKRDQQLPSEKEMLKCKGYIIRNVVGEGTYSKVKRACSVSLEREVAIKIICRDEAPAVFRERFLPREIEILSMVQHPHIVKVYEIFETKIPARVYIVTEFLQYGDLLDHVKENGAVPDVEARYIFVDVCRAVKYLHENSIAHRDIKCENILLDTRQSGQRFLAKLCDFGFARNFNKLASKLKKEKAIECMTSTFCGSAAYASPEILDRKTHNPMQADIWALGIVFFITLFGSMPFDDRDIRAMVKQQKRGDIVSNRTNKVCHAAQDLTAKTLRPNPKHRPTITDLLHHRWLKGNHEEPRRDKTNLIFSRKNVLSSKSAC